MTKPVIKPITKSIKYKKNTKSRKTTKSRKFRKSHLMKGGDDRTTGLPAAYFNGKPSGLSGYFSPGSSELKSSGSNLPVSQGTVWPNGSMMGPNLFPTNGGGCGCSGKKYKNRNSKSKKSSKSRNSKKTKLSNKNKK